jgi:RNA polymerase sigma factor (TIGR02999 family)
VRAAHIPDMALNTPSDVTEMLMAAATGDRGAIDSLYAFLYPELHAQAHRRIRRMPHMTTLDTTSLVNEAYLRFVKAGKVVAENRRHFLAYSSHVMRSVVIDYVRQARALRRGGDAVRLTLNSYLIDSLASPGDELLRLDELLSELAEVDPRLVSVVEMRYFASLGNEEIAECLGVTDRTVRRDLERVRLLLLEAPG